MRYCRDLDVDSAQLPVCNLNATPPASAAEGQRARKAAALHEKSTPKEPEQERWAGKQAGKKEQELSLTAHREQLKTEHADRKAGKRGSNGRARRVYCRLAREQRSREGEGEQTGRWGAQGGRVGGRGGKGGGGRGKHQKKAKSEGVEEAKKADKSGKIKGSRARGWSKKTGGSKPFGPQDTTGT